MPNPVINPIPAKAGINDIITPAPKVFRTT